MRVLVTGAAGFTGSHLAHALAAAGHEVRALIRQPGSIPSYLPAADDHPMPSGAGPDERGARPSPAGVAVLPARPIEVVSGDLRDSGVLARAVAKVDVVYNVAALYRQAGLSAETYRAVNAIAVSELIEQAARAGVRRVVQCSTVGVHGDVERPPANEDAPFKPGDVYQRTKVEGEQRAMDAAAQFGIEVTIARPSGIYGPGDRRLLKLFQGTVRRFPILGRGQIYYHLTYIADLVEGLRLCGEQPAAASRAYILAGGEVTTLNELVALIADVAGVKPPGFRLPVWPFWLAGALCEAVCIPFGLEPPLYRRRVDFYTKSRAFDITRARTELSYDPRVGLRDGIGRTLKWYREHGWL